MHMKALKGFAHKAVCGVSALVLACGLAAFPAAGSIDQAYADSVSTDGYITAASYRAAEPAPEILGLSNVGTNAVWQSEGELTWSAPYYYIFGTAEYNSNPNPYMVNSVSGGTPTLIVYQRQGGPFAKMPLYGSGMKGVDDVWMAKPDIIVGTGSSSSDAGIYQTEEYADTLAAVDSSGKYSPVGVTYDATNVYAMIDVMYNLAAAADAIDAADSTKTLRYGNATEIAKKYEKYVRGTQGYVLMRLAADGAEQKTVALVNGYDSASNTYTLTQTGVAEGTATANRYLEATQFVATNIADDLDDPTVTAEELAKVDLIMLGSQAGQENIASTEDILATFSADMLAKTYWVTSENGSAGSTYGVVMNSVENAQNIGRILGCLYPEYINQANWIAYYYDNFYHIADGKLGAAVDNAMDGVRNYKATDTSNITAMTVWGEADVANYIESDVDLKLSQGVSYLQTEYADDAYLAPSDKAEVTEPTMHRLYNPNSGEHFYTASTSEYEQVKAAGWNDEGTGWVAPAYSQTPVYRMYNKNGGEHHYTTSAKERDGLVEKGWIYEGIGWYSDDDETVALHREYNPNAFANNHNYTTSEKEHKWLLSLGWQDEGTAWYAISAPSGGGGGDDLTPGKV